MALHKPLKTGNSIRLLRVHRSRNGQIDGELESFVLGSRHTPAYRAISYVWGDRTTHRTIVVNGCTISVLISVYTILQALCDTPELFFNNRDSATPAWTWLDSICINQKDVVEVGQQVAYMANIFGEARSAIVWLGPATPQTDKGIELMKLLAMCEEDKPISHPMLKDIEAWRGYQVVAANPWWRRAWTLQESLVPQEVVYHYGTKHLSEKQVRRAILVTNEDFIPKSVSLDMEPWAAMWNRRRITQWYWGRDVALPGQSIGLPALLAYTRHAQATDDEDYIYSLVGCVNATDRSIVGNPNYALSVESIYTAFCRKWIMRHQSLDIICFTTLFKPCRAGVDSGLPSWVPDWRDRPSAEWSASNPVPLLVSQPANKSIGSLIPKRFVLDERQSRRYMAAGDKRAYFQFSNDMAELRCKGATLDKIDGLAGMVDSPLHGSTQVCEPLIQSTSSLNCPSILLESGSVSDADSMAVAEDIALSLVLGRADVYLQHPADANRILAQIKALLQDAESDEDVKERRTREFLAWLRYNTSLLIRGMTLGKALNPKRFDHLRPLREVDVTAADGSEHDIQWKFKKAATLRDMARRLAVTESGHVGIVPQQAQKGDLVCVLYGCSVPVILRPLAKGQYRLVGECYLQGFMEGEAVRDGRYHTQEYNLV
ncbi:hypothetical protein M409DRAFT_27070 [Zasmidium cellare ATCC 36951]|uniref:Heterokaryon incompatibility domain-containing protein n=1 Tax=Zasmidium cellare ATCC 36951 TaxID=1080233 RepID=A0A6A6C602_ZASCE|nr:uncharacterized protein M409DRAFT_27070 [Zasmidium cellare ATCC 36951]KAF2162445.1 hypothetical protein M409DRAFT_27070 [Zasmidium cellare ATCC 36951]